MKVLVAYASKMGGTREIAEITRQALVNRGLSVDLVAADKSTPASGYNAVVVGSGLYAGRWRRPARRFVKTRAPVLRNVPVWFFSSGPLDASASEREIPPTKQVAALMQLAHARAHQTFGGRLPADAKGLTASAMAKKHAGDWRDPDQVRAWANTIADTLLQQTAVPGAASERSGQSN